MKRRNAFKFRRELYKSSSHGACENSRALEPVVKSNVGTGGSIPMMGKRANQISKDFCSVSFSLLINNIGHLFLHGSTSVYYSIYYNVNVDIIDPKNCTAFFLLVTHIDLLTIEYPLNKIKTTEIDSIVIHNFLFYFLLQRYFEVLHMINILNYTNYHSCKCNYKSKKTNIQSFITIVFV